MIINVTDEKYKYFNNFIAKVQRTTILQMSKYSKDLVWRSDILWKYLNQMFFLIR